MDSNGPTFNFLRRPTFQRGLAFGVIILTALFAFEIFNYSTTDYALRDLLGDLTFLGIPWATILAIAFCGIDFAGIARLFTPNGSSNEQGEVWYLFGAWLLAATMNAMLTWWGVSLAVMNHQTLGNEVIARGTLLRIVPIFVAVLVWLIRVLIIGTFSVAGDNLFGSKENRPAYGQQARPAASLSQPGAPVRSLGSRQPGSQRMPAVPSAAMQNSNQNSGASRPYRPAPKTAGQADNSGSGRPEVTYQPDYSMSASERQQSNTRSRGEGNYSPRSNTPRKS